MSNLKYICPLLLFGVSSCSEDAPKLSENVSIDGCYQAKNSQLVKISDGTLDVIDQSITFGVKYDVVGRNPIPAITLDKFYRVKKNSNGEYIFHLVDEKSGGGFYYYFDEGPDSYFVTYSYPDGDKVVFRKVECSAMR